MPARRLIEALTGEYWIFDDGSTHFCDGDVGDVNHEAYALDQANRNLLDALGLETSDEWNSGEETVTKICQLIEEEESDEKLLALVKRTRGMPPTNFARRGSSGSSSMLR